MKLLLAGLMAASSLALAAPATADPMGGDHGDRGGDHGDRGGDHRGDRGWGRHRHHHQVCEWRHHHRFCHW